VPGAGCRLAEACGTADVDALRDPCDDRDACGLCEREPFGAFGLLEPCSSAASVSWTAGLSSVEGAGAELAAPIAPAEGGVTDSAAVGTGMAFCRVARYPPPAAAEMHATASNANASRFDMESSP
jgi:hypothetical protein